MWASNYKVGKVTKFFHTKEKFFQAVERFFQAVECAELCIKFTPQTSPSCSDILSIA